MEDAFFSQLDGAAVRALLLRTGLRDAALFAVSDALHLESCNRSAQQLSGLQPMEDIDPFLSDSTLAVLRRCIKTQTACSAEEEVDGKIYTVEMVPHRGGALLAYLQPDRAGYDGTLRVIQNRSACYLGVLLSEASRVSDPAAAAAIQRACMRLCRLLNHSDLLHDPLLTEQLSLRYCDLAALCAEVMYQIGQRAPAHHAKLTVNTPAHCIWLLDSSRIRIALYNLLTNALRVTPEDGEIVLSLREDADTAVITVADTGPGLDPAQFEMLLSGWRRALSLDDYRALLRRGTPIGLGLPLVHQIAQQHGGCLLLSPRQGGGSELHLVLARLPDTMADRELHAPPIVQDGYTIEEIELSVLE